MNEVDDINEIWHKEESFLPRIKVWIRTRSTPKPIEGYYRDRKFYDEDWNEIKISCEWKYRE